MKLLTLALTVAASLPLSTAAAQGSYTTFGTGCPGTGTGLGASHIVPGIYATAFGGGDNAIPFWSQTTKYQQVFAASEFPVAYTMGGIGFRRDNHATVAIDGALVDLEIKIGYSTHGPGTLSAIFTDNYDLGTPVTVFPRALFKFPDNPGTAATDPQQFDLVIPFPTPFAYAPTPGQNLLIQITQFGSSSPGYAFVMDAGGGTTARLFGMPYTVTSGTLEGFNYGLVMNLFELTHTAVPLLSSDETPQIGNDFPVKLSQARPFAAAVVVLGFSDSSWSGYSLPLDLAFLGAPGCSLLTSVFSSSVESVGADGTAKFTYQIPLQLNLIGLHFYNQWAVSDRTVNPFHFVFSNAGAGVIGV